MTIVSIFSVVTPANDVVDFDGDDMISENDLKEVIRKLTGEQQQLTDEDMKQLIDNVSIISTRYKFINSVLYM